MSGSAPRKPTLSLKKLQDADGEPKANNMASKGLSIEHVSETSEEDEDEGEEIEEDEEEEVVEVKPKQTPPPVPARRKPPSDTVKMADWTEETPYKPPTAAEKAARTRERNRQIKANQLAKQTANPGTKSAQSSRAMSPILVDPSEDSVRNPAPPSSSKRKPSAVQPSDLLEYSDQEPPTESKTRNTVTPRQVKGVDSDEETPAQRARRQDEEFEYLEGLTRKMEIRHAEERNRRGQLSSASFVRHPDANRKPLMSPVPKFALEADDVGQDVSMTDETFAEAVKLATAMGVRNSVSDADIRAAVKARDKSMNAFMASSAQSVESYTTASTPLSIVHTGDITLSSHLSTVERANNTSERRKAAYLFMLNYGQYIHWYVVNRKFKEARMYYQYNKSHFAAVFEPVAVPNEVSMNFLIVLFDALVGKYGTYVSALKNMCNVFLVYNPK